jgi:hypothetical protein
MKHGLVKRVRDWPHSSFHRDVRTGILPVDWAGDIEQNGEFGERRDRQMSLATVVTKADYADANPPYTLKLLRKAD